MSLLNDMLQDLNKIAPARSASLQLPLLNQQRTSIMPKTGLWFAVAGILFVFGAVLIYLTKFSAPIAVSVVTQPKPVQNIAIAVSIPSPPLISSIPAIPSPPLVSFLVPVPVFPEPSVAQNPESTTFDPKELTLLAHEKLVLPVQDAWSDELLDKALDAIQDGNDPRAIELLELILTRFPASVDARENLAALYLSHAELARAYDILDEGLKLDPHNLRLTIMKSRLLVEEGQHREALALLEKFNPDINKAPEYYAVLAAVFEALGRTNEAGSLYQSLIRLDPSNGQYWLGLGIALEHKQSFQQATEAYKKASQSINIQPAVRSYAENRLKILQG